jgi:hypothetical protein
MDLTLERIGELGRGEIDCIEIGQLPQHVAKALGLKNPLVYLSRDSLGHIRQEHPDLTDVELLLASRAIATGLLIREKNKPYLLACFQHPEDANRRYKANMKIAAGNADMWLTTFHRTHPRQTRALLQRGEILRKHK